jgi:hypothetical protein
MGWRLTKLSGPLGSASDLTVPVYQVVDDTRLKEMLVGGWNPEDVW